MQSIKTIEPRKFALNKCAAYPKLWFNGSAMSTYHLNILAVYIPHGEKFFINSVKNFQHLIQDTNLKKQVRGFLQQEAHHAKAHTTFYQKAILAYYPSLDITKYKFWITKAFGILGGKKFRLAMTAAGEHYTAIVSHTFLSNPGLFEQMPSHIAKLWQWHFIEEIEHKAVAFDVMQSQKIGYFTRFTAFWVMSAFLMSCYIRPFFHMARKDKHLFNLKFYKDFISFLWIKPGISRKSLWHYFSYLKPGFHPWQFNNKTLIQQHKFTNNMQV